jgi:hypothetical protein
LLLVLIVFSATISAVLVRFDKFLQIAFPALVFTTGISWAVRTANLGRYVVDEISMETYIYLYDDAGGEIERSYRRIIENHNERSKILLEAAKFSSYMTLYFFFSVLFLFTAEMLVLIYNSPQHCYLSHCHCVWWTAIGFFVISLFFFFCACASLGIHGFSNGNKEKCTNEGKGKLMRCFKRGANKFTKCSVWLCKNTVILKEDWVRFYRTEDWMQFYHDISEGRASKELSERTNKLREEFKPSEWNLESVIEKHPSLIFLLKSDEGC